MATCAPGRLLRSVPSYDFTGGRPGNVASTLCAATAQHVSQRGLINHAADA